MTIYIDSRKEYQKKYRQEHRKEKYERDKKWRKAHPEKVKEYAKRYRQTHRNQRREYNREWRKKNPEKIKKTKLREYYKHRDKYRERNIRWLKEHPDKKKEKERRYYQKHKGEISRKSREYRKKHIDKIKEREKRYYKTPMGKLKDFRHHCNRRKKYPVVLSKKDYLTILQRDKICVYCGSDKNLGVDHINSNGSTTFSNLVLCCTSCNSSKGIKNVFDWCKEQRINTPEIVIRLTKDNQSLKTTEPKPVI